MKINVKKELKDIIWTLISALVSVVSLHTFVVPANFSPSGVDGLATILYEITGWNIGWFKLLVNVPLMVLAWIFLNKKYVFYVTFFTLLDSFGVIILESINFYTFIPAGLTDTDAVGYRLLSAIFSGVMLGVCVGLMLKIGYSSGGMDIVAGLVHKWKPHFKIERVISICAYTIVGISYFVYGDLTSILLSVIQIFVSEWTITALLRRERFAMEVKVITKEPDKIKDEILYKYKHSATVVKAQGMYSGDDYYMVISVLNSQDVPTFMNTMKRYPETFVYFSDGVRVQGEFHFTDDKEGGRTEAYQ